MLAHHFRLYAERIDLAKNISRYYALELSETLFGDVCVIRRWGRIGTLGNSMTCHFGDEKDAVAAFLDVAARKRARGYRPRPLRM